MRKVRRADQTWAVYCELCLCCGRLVHREEGQPIEVEWQDSLLRGDECGDAKRISRHRLCATCATVLHDSGRRTVEVSGVELELVLRVSTSKWKTRGDRLWVCDGSREEV